MTAYECGSRVDYTDDWSGHYRRQLRVRDNGKGIDPKILAEGGRAGHHGLPGMRERAKLVGGELPVNPETWNALQIRYCCGVMKSEAKWKRVSFLGKSRR